MKYPNFNEEKKLWKKGFKFVAGLDEAGRGPLAGPVVAAVVIIKSEKVVRSLKVNDSKKLSENQRESIYSILINHKDLWWGIGIVSEKVIDRINILEATKLAMLRSIRQVQRKLKGNIGYLLLDGNFKIVSEISQKSIIKGDQKVFSISSASIIAKVTRDRIMVKYDKKYPEYGFKKHKGYPTASHRKVLKTVGQCPIHRKSFSWE